MKKILWHRGPLKTSPQITSWKPMRYSHLDINELQKKKNKIKILTRHKTIKEIATTNVLFIL